LRRLSTVPTVPAGAEVLLFSYKICPYCCKTKAFLDFKEIPYSEVEVSPLTKRQIKWSAQYKKVPIAVFTGGEVVNDSAKIIDVLLAKQGAASDPHFASTDARVWADWASSRLAVYMYPNMTRTFAECRSALAYMSEAKGISFMDSFLTQTIGAFGMSMAHGKIKQKYGIADERAALLAVIDEWVEELGKSAGPFRQGARPDLGDISVYGVLNAARGVKLYKELREHGDGRLGAWMSAMDKTISPPRIVS
jgi:microsomal prostaglandin-E synthase 2